MATSNRVKLRRSKNHDSSAVEKPESASFRKLEKAEPVTEEIPATTPDIHADMATGTDSTTLHVAMTSDGSLRRIAQALLGDMAFPDTERRVPADLRMPNLEIRDGRDITNRAGLFSESDMFGRYTGAALQYTGPDLREQTYTIRIPSHMDQGTALLSQGQRQLLNQYENAIIDRAMQILPTNNYRIVVLAVERDQVLYLVLGRVQIGGDYVAMIATVDDRGRVMIRRHHLAADRRVAIGHVMTYALGME